MTLKPKVRKKPALDQDPAERYAIPELPGERFVEVALDLKGWQPASEVLDRTTAVPTCFFDFDRRNTVGGLPVRRLHTVYGPTTGGKSAFVLGLLQSFLAAGHVAAYVDAEHATGQEFVEYLMAGMLRHPNFKAKRPKSYEQTIDDVDELIAAIAAARAGGKDGRPPPMPNLASIAIVDSINKLVPKRELDAIKRHHGEEIGKGHFGRVRAAINQAWLDHLVPLLADANMGMVLIAQEREESDGGNAAGWSKRAAEDAIVHIKGGKAVQFDSSMLMRVTRIGPVWDSDVASSGAKDDEDAQKARKTEPIVGWRHKIRIRKSKVGQLETSYTDCVFHVSTGRGMAPLGFDRVRDAVMVGTDLGCIVKSGSWLTFGRSRWQGARKLLERLYQDESLRSELYGSVRAAIEREAGRGAG